MMVGVANLDETAFSAAQDRYNWEVQAERLVGVYRYSPSLTAISQMRASR